MSGVYAGESRRGGNSAAAFIEWSGLNACRDYCRGGLAGIRAGAGFALLHDAERSTSEISQRTFVGPRPHPWRGRDAAEPAAPCPAHQGGKNTTGRARRGARGGGGKE